jgi:hypothetical protein
MSEGESTLVSIPQNIQPDPSQSPVYGDSSDITVNADATITTDTNHSHITVYMNLHSVKNVDGQTAFEVFLQKFWYTVHKELVYPSACVKYNN